MNRNNSNRDRTNSKNNNHRSTNSNNNNHQRQQQQQQQHNLQAEFEAKLRSMQQRNQGNETLTQSNCDEVLGLCVASNAWDRVLEVLAVMEAQNLSSQRRSTYRACLEACHKAGNADSATDILDAMARARLVPPSGQDVGQVMATLCQHDDGWKRAARLLTNYTDNGNRYRSSTEATDTAKLKDNDEDEQNNAVPPPSGRLIPVEYYDTLLFHMAKSSPSANAWSQLLSTMEMSMSTEPLTHPKPQLSTYNVILEALSRAGQPEKALQILLKNMPENDVIPNTHSYNQAVAACLKKGQWQSAMTVLEARHKNDAANTYNNANPPPSENNNNSTFTGTNKAKAKANYLTPATTVTYNSVISCCAKAGEVQPALDLLKTMRRRGVKPDTVTYNALMSACVSNYKWWKTALTLLDECHREAGVDPDVVTYTVAVRACGRGGMTTRALTLFEVIKDKGELEPDVYLYTSVMDVCAKAGMWRRALELLDEMRNEPYYLKPNAFTYSVAISACGKGGQWERALELMTQMREKRVPVNTVTYNAAISALANASAKQMRMSGKDSASTHNSKLRVRATKNSRKELERGIVADEDNDDDDNEDSDTTDQGPTQELWEKALGLIDQMKRTNVPRDAITYSCAIKACGAAGRWKEALTIIEVMQRSPVPKNRPNRISYTNAITACGRSGRHEEALRLFEDMKKDGVRPDRVSYNALLSAFKTADQAEAVWGLWQEMCGKDNNKGGISISPDMITVTDAINGLERSKGYRDKSDAVFEEAVQRKLLFKADSLDTVWETDLSGMSFPVAHAAVRYCMRQVLEIANGGSGNVVQDLTFITGVGRAKSSSGMADDGNAPVALREFVRDCMVNEFTPPIYSLTPKHSAGVVTIKKEVLTRWIAAQSPS